MNYSRYALDMRSSLELETLVGCWGSEVINVQASDTIPLRTSVYASNVNTSE